MSRHIVIIVLGDVGRSPRMQYHACSLLQEGHVVTLVGYQGERLVPYLEQQQQQQQEQKRLHVIRFQTSKPPSSNRILSHRLVYLIWRCCSLVYGLFCALWNIPNSAQHPVYSILVQNPPAIPLLAMAYLYSKFFFFFLGRQTPRFIIDWHNLGYTMFTPTANSTTKLSTSLRFLQWCTRSYEAFWGPLADGHYTVTQAMAQHLQSTFNIPSNRISVLYDCPPAMFQPLSVQQVHDFISNRLQPTLLTNDNNSCLAKSPWSNNDPSSTSDEKTKIKESTIFTERLDDGMVRMRPDRPALVVSSTSWTEDEDFSILLDALCRLDEQLKQQDTTKDKKHDFGQRRILVIVTGKGPMKALYETIMAKLQLSHVFVTTAWLEPQDYPKLLACADLGVSLHTSTSGLDLPMKVLDCFGCATPVCAIQFNCLHELVQDHVNGRIFETSEELQQELHELLVQDVCEEELAQPKKRDDTLLLPHGFGRLATYSRNLQNRKRWHENWMKQAKPMLIHEEENSATAANKNSKMD